MSSGEEDGGGVLGPGGGEEEGGAPIRSRVLEGCIDPGLLRSFDEIKVYSSLIEGLEEEEDEEIRGVLSEEKASLIEETEFGGQHLTSLDLNTLAAAASIRQENKGKPDSSSPSSPLLPGYPLPYINGGTPPSSTQAPAHPNPPTNSCNNNNNKSSGTSGNSSTASNMVQSPESPESPYLYNGNSNDPLGSPPPAHLGGLPYNLASDGGKGLRSSLYSSPSAGPTNPSSSPGYAYPSSILGPGDQFAGSCSFPRFGGLFGGFPPGMPGSLESDSPQMSSSHPILNGNHPRLPSSLSSSGSPSSGNSGSRSLSRSSSSSKKTSSPSSSASKTHIKKPLNAFMLYMKEMRPTIVAECTLKESAAINQILGRRWHSLSREEQAKYYESARKERQLHMQMYPGWSARDNYAQNKKKKRKREASSPNIKTSSAGSVLVNNIKKCRARYGMDQQDLWCKPCNPMDSSSTSRAHPGDPLFLHQSGSGISAGMMQGEDLTLDPRLNSHFLFHHVHPSHQQPPPHHHAASHLHPALELHSSHLDLSPLSNSSSSSGNLPPLTPLPDSRVSNGLLDPSLEALKHNHPGGPTPLDDSSPKYISL